MRCPAPGPQAPSRGAAAAACSAMLADFSLDITSGELGDLGPARAVLPAGTPVQLAFPDGADLAERVSTAAGIKEAGFTPVPIIAARRLRSRQMLREYLAALQGVDASESVLVVAGDPVQPQGPYPDAASVIGSGLLEERGVRQASVAGHPGGHPAVADGVLWAALTAKTAALRRRGLGGELITQFGFDAAQVLTWLAEVRARGIGLPVRVSVPGPATVRRLLAIASRCGVDVSAPVAEEYGFSLTGPTRTAGPGRFVQTLASGYDPRLHGEVKLHFNAFGGFSATVEWISRLSGRPAAATDDLRLIPTQENRNPMTSHSDSTAQPRQGAPRTPGGPALIAGRTVARVGYGAMHLRNLRHDRDEAIALLRRAVELGVNHVDTAQFYGDGFVNELIREAVGPDDGVTVVTKVGADPDPGGPYPIRMAQRPEELAASVDANLASLGLDRVPVVNLRRPDASTPVPVADEQVVDLDDQLAALTALRDAGKIGAIGLSGVTLGELRRALPAGIACVQNEYSLVSRGHEDMLQLCAEAGIAWVPYFPLGGALPGSPKVTDQPAVLAAAESLRCTPAQVGLAWLLGHAPNILLIPGTTSARHLAENLAAGALTIDTSTLAALDAIPSAAPA